MQLWEILVPCVMLGKLVTVRHHKRWDEYVRRISGGLTILTPGKGQWTNKETGILHEERVIPVRIACDENQINDIIGFTLKHYKQFAVMAYLVSEKVLIVNEK